MIDARIGEAFARLPDYLGGHVLVSVTALGLGLAVSLPLGIAAARRKRLRAVALGVASVIQTIPGLALLTLFYPLLLAIAALSERMTGKGFSALGFLPAVLALAFYSVLPVLRNTVTGLDAVSEGMRDSARALGMHQRQILWLVELPLALPVIMAGIRTAAVWVIGTATLSTPIGQTSLGNYIFAGLQTQNWVFVLFGCFAAAALAIAVDQLLALMERGLARHSRGQLAAGAAGILVLIGLAVAPGFAQPQARYVIGTKPFTEQYLLAALIEQRLAAAGLSASQRQGLGSSVVFDALAAGEIDVYVDYSGTLWANQMNRTDSKTRGELLGELAGWLQRERGIVMLGTLGFENAYALLTRHAAGIDSIGQLAPRAGQLAIAGDYEFFARPEWQKLRGAYGLNFREQRTMQAEFMYPALNDGQVDVIAGYSSDGQIAKFGLVTLADPKQAIPPYDAVLLVSSKRAGDEKFLAALKPLVGAISIETMREANLKASGGGADGSPAEVAKWLSEKIRR
jgi:osmoprotectant transport system permease protein